MIDMIEKEKKRKLEREKREKYIKRNTCIAEK